VAVWRWLLKGGSTRLLKCPPASANCMPLGGPLHSAKKEWQTGIWVHFWVHFSPE